MICRHTLLRRNVAEHVLLLLVFSPHRSSCRTLTFFLASSGDQRGAFFNKLLKQKNAFNSQVALAYLAILNSPIMNDFLAAVSNPVQGGQWDLSARFVQK